MREYWELVVRGKRENVEVRGGVMMLVLVSGLLVVGLERRGRGLCERRGGDGDAVNVLPPDENLDGERRFSGDKHSGESACELAVWGLVLSVALRIVISGGGMWSLNPLSLGLLEVVDFEFGGVEYLGGVIGLSGTGLGIRGETSGVRPYFRLVLTVESTEYNSFPCLFAFV
jgi:hypothetical protein